MNYDHRHFIEDDIARTKLCKSHQPITQEGKVTRELMRQNAELERFSRKHLSQDNGNGNGLFWLIGFAVIVYPIAGLGAHHAPSLADSFCGAFCATEVLHFLTNGLSENWRDVFNGAFVVAMLLGYGALTLLAARKLQGPSRVAFAALAAGVVALFLVAPSDRTALLLMVCFFALLFNYSAQWDAIAAKALPGSFIQRYWRRAAVVGAFALFALPLGPEGASL